MTITPINVNTVDFSELNDIEVVIAVAKADTIIEVTNEVQLSRTYGDAVVDVAYTTNSDAVVVIEYKLATADDSAYSATVPTNAGSYVVRVTAPSTANYNASSDTAQFTIAKAAPKFEIPIVAWYEGLTIGDIQLPAGCTFNAGENLNYVVSTTNYNTGRFWINVDFAETENYTGYTNVQ